MMTNSRIAQFAAAARARAMALVIGAVAACLAMASVPAADAEAAVAHTASARAPLPQTADSIWREIDAKSKALQKNIASGALDQVHHHAFAIRDLVATLVTHSATLAPDRLAKVKSGAKFVATLADRLDATGDAKDLAGTKQNFAKLVKVLTNLRANYASR